MRLNTRQVDQLAVRYADAKLAAEMQQAGDMTESEYFARRALYRHVLTSVAAHPAARGYAGTDEAETEISRAADGVLAPFISEVDEDVLATQYPAEALDKRVTAASEPVAPASFSSPLELATRAYKRVESEAGPESADSVIAIVRRATLTYHLTHSLAVLHGPDAQVPLSDDDVLGLVFGTDASYVTRQTPAGGLEMELLTRTAQDAGGTLVFG